MSEYDVIVIGVGTAGSKAAATAVADGARVLAVDSAEELGGLCILRGCMPTKTLLETAHRLHEIRDAKRFGIDVAEPTLDFPAHMERMRSLVARFQRAKVGGIERGGYELVRGTARFTGPHTVDVDGQEHTAKAFVLATGSVVRPFPWPVPEGVRLVTSDAMFTLEQAPERAMVLGAGAVALEFAQWLARVGTQVTLVNRSALLWRQDLEMGAELTAALREEMTVLAPAAIEGFEDSPEGPILRCTVDGEAQTHAVGDLLLNATGRVPNFAGLDLEAAGLDAKALELSTGFQTSVPHIFVAGDATGSNAILHEANYEGEVVGHNAARVALGGDLVSYDSNTPPMSAIFSDPPAAFVGLTPTECDARGIAYAKAVKRFPEQGRGIVQGCRHGFVQLVAEPDGGKVLGCQILGPDADDLIHIPAAVICLGGTVGQMRRIPWYHPTLAEAFVEVCRELE